MKKNRTYEQVQTAQERAVNFLRNVLEDDDRADEVEAMSPDEWADEKGIVITNPEKEKEDVANGNGGNGSDDVGSMMKANLVDLVDQVTGILEDAYSPESSREDLASAIGDALDVLEGNGGDEDEDTDGDDYDDADTVSG
jgi:hypothetical protein